MVSVRNCCWPVAATTDCSNRASAAVEVHAPLPIDRQHAGWGRRLALRAGRDGGKSIWPGPSIQSTVGCRG